MEKRPLVGLFHTSKHAPRCGVDERSGVQIASVVQTGRVYGYAFDDGLNLVDAYTQDSLHRFG